MEFECVLDTKNNASYNNTRPSKVIQKFNLKKKTLFIPLATHKHSLIRHPRHDRIICGNNSDQDLTISEVVEDGAGGDAVVAVRAGGVAPGDGEAPGGGAVGGLVVVAAFL